MLASKQIAFGKAAGAAKPYKARLEYLESKGYEYIDTLWIPTATAKLSLEINVLNSTMNSNPQIGCINEGGKPYYNLHWGLIGGTELMRLNFYFGDFNDEDYLYVVGDKHNIGWHEKTKITFDGATGDVSINGVGFVGAPIVNDVPSYPFYLFARNNSNNPELFAHARIYRFTIEDLGEKVLDLIPVLDKAGVPCMYDEVSGEFFYNQGTGEFIAGPVVDDVEYTAKDYVQDGLVAMWDGIENVGLDAPHDSQSLIWKNLGSLGDMYDAVRSVGTFQDDGAEFSFYTPDTKFKIPNYLMRTHMKGEWSYQVVFTPHEGWFQNSSGIFGGHGNGLGIVSDYENGECRFCIFSPLNGWLTDSSTFNAYKKYSITQSGSSTSKKLKTWLNGVLVHEVNVSSATLTYGYGDTFIGSDYLIEDTRTFDGLIHSVRIYNRPIDDDVITYNNEIDKARFGL